MKARTEKILFTAVKDFIKTGKNITSEGLFSRYNFGIKPAMIRWELNNLCQLGYLYQPHHSSGRIPTNKAYRFFVSKILEDQSTINISDEKFNDVINKFLNGEIKAFIEELSNQLQLLSIGYKIKEKLFLSSGLFNLLKSLDLLDLDHKEILSIVKDFEEIPQKISGDFFNDDLNWPKIFIGKNKFLRSDCVAVIADHFDFQDDGFLLLTIGPKRMNYTQPLTLFKLLDQSLK